MSRSFLSTFLAVFTWGIQSKALAVVSSAQLSSNYAASLAPAKHGAQDGDRAAARKSIWAYSSIP
jgi:hypothetical protein